MKPKTLVPAILLAALLAAAAYALPKNGVTLYYGTECPHCIELEKFLDESGLAKKVAHARKEVWHDEANARELGEKARACGIAGNEVGVPFLAVDGKCLVGKPDIEAYFKSAAEDAK